MEIKRNIQTPSSYSLRRGCLTKIPLRSELKADTEKIKRTHPTIAAATRLMMAQIFRWRTEAFQASRSLGFCPSNSYIGFAADAPIFAGDSGVTLQKKNPAFAE